MEEVEEDLSQLKAELRFTKRLNNLLIGLIGFFVIGSLTIFFLALPIQVQILGPDIPKKIAIKGKNETVGLSFNIDETDTSIIIRSDLNLIPGYLNNTVDQGSVGEGQAALSAAIYGD